MNDAISATAVASEAKLTASMSWYCLSKSWNDDGVS